MTCQIDSDFARQLGQPEGLGARMMDPPLESVRNSLYNSSVVTSSNWSVQGVADTSQGSSSLRRGPVPRSPLSEPEELSDLLGPA